MTDTSSLAGGGTADGSAGHTRRSFVRGIAVAGASTAAAVALDAAGVTNLVGESAVAAGAPTAFSDFRAIAPSSADQVQVPEGFRADVLIRWNDEFASTDGTVHRYGFNNDFMAYLPLEGTDDEALLFVNHEYPAPFFLHGKRTAAEKTAADIAEEKYAVGNSILHVRRGADGVWQVVSPSKYNRRITGDFPACDVTGPLKGKGDVLLADGTTRVRVGQSAERPDQIDGSVANCSGGTTPWGTTLSCEENYQDYGPSSAYGWGGTYLQTTHANYGWVVEHDPYDPTSRPRKHTALGRFRHENTAFNAHPGKPFVLYMGDDKVNEGVYKFVSARSYVPGDRANNLKILEEGTLYIAKWSPEGRRRFGSADTSSLLTADVGTGEWVKVEESELVDTAAHLRKRIDATEGAGAYDRHYATNRPEDVEVDVDGTVYVAFTNNSGVNDQHGAVRKLRERRNDPTATTFTWEDYHVGGPQPERKGIGEEGMSCVDNLVFDDANNLWAVTDISSSSLKGSPGAKAFYEYHGNNAIFMIPRSGPNAGVAYRFANMPVEAEGTGPYFSSDFSTLFVNVQHPGEETPANAAARLDAPETFTSWWPEGNRTAGVNPSMPRPSTVAITRVREDAPDGGGAPTIPPAAPRPGAPTPPQGPGAPAPTGRTTVDVPTKATLSGLVGSGVPVRFRVREDARVTVRLRIRLPKVGRSKARLITAATVRKTVQAGAGTVRVRPGAAARALLRLRRGRTMRAEIVLEVRPKDGSPASIRRSDRFTIR
ncbi:alkaline phosphatase PhoX [Patulibacter sp. SYSU D01012]|uniref:PhoX family protein n=1 Tax=Patulibacter sp. SYSU D01012 TaxID=2817381 RepID=UPI001B310651|nr:alkaline phosphatase PhoX [Patulibacter sp. SYSU D01012]